MIGRAPSSASLRSIAHTSCLRFPWSASIDCRSISLSTSGLLAIDVDLLQLVDQDHRRVAQIWEVARRYLDLEAVISAVAELLHEPAGVRAVFLHIGVIARQGLQEIRRHAPQSCRWGLNDPADVALSL